ncbi:MAG: hypothetical protein A3H98_10420 [Bacteroidetes bacterium RIFCSPLOWO2_02_FULL_36_8]|nr:MAG: hypothetical protein A3H98_10420 [Bacteroidetes bacterium RIFCSPLOWO2_02_FULL_36_8]OFY70945.1 MAG: hypothetical protein A3G23_12570 [Bacteroidetes bacterium RIFCSPLOWO2_12_FULL_37_12]
MLTTIKGIYNHGQIILTEQPPVKTKTVVMITFLPAKRSKTSQGKQKIILGLLEGKIKLSDDFNKPLDDLKEYM